MGRSKRSFDLLMMLWPLGKVQSWAAQQPVLGCFVHADVSPDHNRHIIIPVNRVIRGTESVALPPVVLEALVTRASRRAALNQCLCRRAEHCHTYSRNIGCLFLGDAASQINPELSRALSPDEALAHARQAIALGLTPMIVHAAYDAELLGIDYNRMLAVCFCCDCCCTVRKSLRSGPHAFEETVLRFPGLRVEVGPECNGCGQCLDLCAAAAISLEGGRTVIGEACKGCGRCAAACPQGAIALHLDDGMNVMERLFALVEERTTIEAADRRPSEAGRFLSYPWKPSMNATDSAQPPSPDGMVSTHRALDAAVPAAYGWPTDLSNDESLARLLALNLARAGNPTG